jgi:hypothetical protein
MYDLLVYDRDVESWITVDGFLTEEEATEYAHSLLHTVGEDGYIIVDSDLRIEYVG